MDKLYSALGIHTLKLFVSQLKAANSLAVGSQARKNVLDDLETRIKQEDEKRITQEDKDKLFAIQLLLNVLRAKDIADFNEQKKLYDQYFRSSMNMRFANTPSKPAPKTIKLAKQVIEESLASLSAIIQKKRSETPEAEAARQRRREQERKEANELANMFFTEARLKEMNAARRHIATMPVPPSGTGLTGGRKTRKGRKGKKGKKGTRKH